LPLSYTVFVVVPPPFLFGSHTSRRYPQVIKYCEHHKDDAPTSEDQLGMDSEIVGFDADFVKVDQATLFEMILVRLHAEPQGLLPGRVD